MKRKSNHKKNKKKEKEILTKEVGVYDDFLIIEKEGDKKETNLENKNINLTKDGKTQEEIKSKDDLNDLSFLKDWTLLENPFKKPKPKK